MTGSEEWRIKNILVINCFSDEFLNTIKQRQADRVLWNLQIFMKQWANLKGCVFWMWLGNFLAELQNRKDLHLDYCFEDLLPKSWAKLFLMWKLGGRKFSYTLFAPPVPCARGKVLVRVAKKMSGSVWGWRGRNLSQDTWEMLWSSTHLLTYQEHNRTSSFPPPKPKFCLKGTTKPYKSLLWHPNSECWGFF